MSFLSDITTQITNWWYAPPTKKTTADDDTFVVVKKDLDLCSLEDLDAMEAACKEAQHAFFHVEHPSLFVPRNSLDAPHGSPLRRFKLQKKTRAKVLHKVLQAVAYLEKKRIPHGNISLDTIYLDGEQQVCLTGHQGLDTQFIPGADAAQAAEALLQLEDTEYGLPHPVFKNLMNQELSAQEALDLLALKVLGEGQSALVLRTEHSAQKWFKLRGLVKHEAEILKQLTHPNIVTFLSVDPTVGLLDMEYVGPSLAESTGFDPVQVVRDVLQALDFLATKKIVHRDVKPENIALGPQEAKLIDFGAALERQGIEVPRLGSPRFWPPEVISVSSKVKGAMIKDTLTAGQDLWAIGVVAYELIEGQRFATHRTNLPMFHHCVLSGQGKAVGKGCCPPFEMKCKQVEKCVRGLLAIDPAQRLSAATALTLLPKGHGGAGADQHKAKAAL